MEENRARAKKMLLSFGIFSIVMLFAGLTSAYLVSFYGEFWVNIKLPREFHLSTGFIIFSSISMYFAVKAVRKNQLNKATPLLILTLILGLAFAVCQYLGWKALAETGNFLSGHADNLTGVYGEDYTFTYYGEELIYEDGMYYSPSDVAREEPLNEELAVKNNTASSYLIALVFVHICHLVGGVAALIWAIILAARKKYTADNHVGLNLTATYWHFLDALWLYLFLFLLFIH